MSSFFEKHWVNLEEENPKFVLLLSPSQISTNLCPGVLCLTQQALRKERTSKATSTILLRFYPGTTPAFVPNSRDATMDEPAVVLAA